MAVSEGLQKYFDSQNKEKTEIQGSLDALRGQIAPEFIQSFEAFHDKILNIVDEAPEASNIVAAEIVDLSSELQEKSAKKSLQQQALIIDHAEAA